jgi:glycine/D-amino acid oxidase-like deaminating enzyme
MKVTRLPIDPGTSGWNAVLPPQHERRELEGNITADWLVIGAGFSGLAAARRLKQLHPKDRVVVLEARRVAHGPAGRNSGFMIDLPHNLDSKDYGGELDQDRKFTRLNRTAIEFAAGIAEEFDLGSEAFARSGKVNAAATPKGLHHNETYARHLTRLGEPHDMLDQADMKTMTGSDYYLGGLFTPGAAVVQPALYVRGLARGLDGAGVDIFEMSPVTGFERSGADWIGHTPKGQVTAPRVILSVNGHVESFGYFSRRLVHIYLYASMTRALTDAEVKQLGGQPRWGVTPADPLGSTVRRISGTGGDRIIVRNRVTYNPDRCIRQTAAEEFAHSHDASFRHRFPMLPDVTMEHRWGGLLCLSRNNATAFGELEPGLYSACCQNGLGVAKGHVTGLLAAELASGLSSQLIDDLKSDPLPSRIPPEPIAWLGATATLRWGEFRAGREL